MPMKSSQGMALRHGESRLRMAAAALIVVALAVLGARLLPIYLDNMRLQSYVEGITQSAASRTRPDDVLRVEVMEKAASLGLPVGANNVHIKRTEDDLRIDVRYIVRVDLPMYTVDLHFYPGSR
jgi:hypothetical protein